MTGGSSKTEHFQLPQSKIKDFCQLPQNEGAEAAFGGRLADKPQFNDIQKESAARVGGTKAYSISTISSFSS